MASLQNQLLKAKELNKVELVSSLFDFIRSIEAEIKELNKKQINEFSIDIYGNALGFYSKATERITTDEWEQGLRREEDIKYAGDPFTLRDTGVFLDYGLFARVTDQLVTFGSTDPKTDEVLSNLLSKEIFGLTDTNLNFVIRNKILPFYIQHFRKTLDL